MLSAWIEASHESTLQYRLVALHRRMMSSFMADRDGLQCHLLGVSVVPLTIERGEAPLSYSRHK